MVAQMADMAIFDYSSFFHKLETNITQMAGKRQAPSSHNGFANLFKFVYFV
jgi:hypothetical protein